MREEERALLLVLAEEAVTARRNGLTLADSVESLEQLHRLWRAADRVIAFRRAAGAGRVSGEEAGG